MKKSLIKKLEHKKKKKTFSTTEDIRQRFEIVAPSSAAPIVLLLLGAAVEALHHEKAHIAVRHSVPRLRGAWMLGRHK
jgi:hypothetical protein